jgi:alpha-L-fucosidase
MDRLNKLGDWLAVNGEGIFDSRPWVKASSGEDVRFTHKGDSLYVYVQTKPGATSLTIPGIAAANGTKIRVLGAVSDSEFKQQGQGVSVSLKNGAGLSGYATGLRITPVPASV